MRTVQSKVMPFVHLKQENAIGPFTCSKPCLPERYTYSWLFVVGVCSSRFDDSRCFVFSLVNHGTCEYLCVEILGEAHTAQNVKEVELKQGAR